MSGKMSEYTSDRMSNRGQATYQSFRQTICQIEWQRTFWICVMMSERQLSSNMPLAFFFRILDFPFPKYWIQTSTFFFNQVGTSFSHALFVNLPSTRFNLQFFDFTSFRFLPYPISFQFRLAHLISFHFVPNHFTFLSVVIKLSSTSFRLLGRNVTSFAWARFASLSSNHIISLHFSTSLAFLSLLFTSTHFIFSRLLPSFYFTLIDLVPPTSFHFFHIIAHYVTLRHLVIFFMFQLFSWFVFCRLPFTSLCIL